MQKKHTDFLLGAGCTLLAIFLLLLTTSQGFPERGSGRNPLNPNIYATDAEKEKPTEPGEDRREPRPKVAYPPTE